MSHSTNHESYLTFTYCMTRVSLPELKRVSVEVVIKTVTVNLNENVIESSRRKTAEIHF